MLYLVFHYILFTYECKFSGSRAPGLTYGYCLVSMITKYVVGCLVTMIDSLLQLLVVQNPDVIDYNGQTGCGLFGVWWRGLDCDFRITCLIVVLGL